MDEALLAEDLRLSGARCVSLGMRLMRPLSGVLPVGVFIWLYYWFSCVLFYHLDTSFSAFLHWSLTCLFAVNAIFWKSPSLTQLFMWRLLADTLLTLYFMWDVDPRQMHTHYRFHQQMSHLIREQRMAEAGWDPYPNIERQSLNLHINAAHDLIAGRTHGLNAMIGLVVFLIHIILKYCFGRRSGVD